MGENLEPFGTGKAVSMALERFCAGDRLDDRPKSSVCTCTGPLNGPAQQRNMVDFCHVSGVDGIHIYWTESKTNPSYVIPLAIRSIWAGGLAQVEARATSHLSLYDILPNVGGEEKRGREASILPPRRIARFYPLALTLSGVG